MISNLYPLAAGISAGAAIGVSLGFLFAARAEAINGVARKSHNPFSCFFRRPLRNVILIEWFIYAAIVLSGCLTLLWLAAMPLLLSRWLALPGDMLLVAAYAVGIFCCSVAYPFGRKLWLNRA
jgi:membrane-bound acyltransferase YfiQ involved in biofilm formation